MARDGILGSRRRMSRIRRRCSMSLGPLVALAAVFCIDTASFAEVKIIERTFKGTPGQEIRVGVFVNIRPDCSSGPLPTIRLASPPSHGNVMIRQGKANITNLHQCLAVEAPAFIAFYRSAPDFVGNDELLLEIRPSEGSTEQQKITVTLSAGPEKL
jgi:hypothetical protein